MDVKPTIVDAIGNTPLVRLARASALTGCEILGKAEFMNPGQSVKDRAAKQMILAAEAAGRLKPGGLIVEGTAGNTGIGLALVARARGYRTIIVIPDTQSQEKKDALKLAGATLIEVPAKPYSDPDNYQHVARRLADQLARSERDGVLFADQWNNLENRNAHYLTTGPEIWRQTDGKVDGFVASVGTGGTLAGTAAALREKKAAVVIACADPEGAAMASYFTTGEAHVSPGSSITEGIGLGRSTPIVGDVRVDHAWTIADSEAIPLLFDLAEHEGLVLGGSSGVNIAGAIRLAREMGPGHTIVTVLCDYGTRYQSKLYNPDFLKAHHLPVPAWLTARPEIKVPFAGT
jgi:cysteine synthase A